MKMGKTKVATIALIVLIMLIATVVLFFDREEFTSEIQVENPLRSQTENTPNINITSTEHDKNLEPGQTLLMPDEYDGSIEVSAIKEIGQGGPIEVHSGESGPEYPDADNIIPVEYQYNSSEALNAPEVENLPDTEHHNNLVSNTDNEAELPKDEEPPAPRYESSDNIYPEPAPEMDAEEN